MTEGIVLHRLTQVEIALESLKKLRVTMVKGNMNTDNISKRISELSAEKDSLHDQLSVTII